MTEGILDRLLATLDVRVHAFAVCHVQKGWRLVFAPMNAVIIHYVLSGHGVLRVGNGTSFPFGPHSILIVPPRIGQSLGTSDGNLREAGAADNCLMMADGLIRFAAGAGEKDIFTACGTISATYNGALGLFDTLLQPLIEDVSRVTRLQGAFQTLFEELSHPDIGTRALSEALMKQCLVLLLRHYLADHGVESPLFAALQDPRLARAITAVLSRPDERHGLDDLAEQAGMSRSAFSEQFPGCSARALRCLSNESDFGRPLTFWARRIFQSRSSPTASAMPVAAIFPARSETSTASTLVRIVRYNL